MDVMQSDGWMKKSKERKKSVLVWDAKQIFSQVVNSDINLKILSIPKRITLSQIQLCKYEGINTLTFFLTQLEVIHS